MDCSYIIDWLMMQDWEALTGIASVVIALCVLVFTVWAGWRTHVHNKLSVKPHLTTWTSRWPEQQKYSIQLVNNGLGPALIKRFVVRLDNNVIKGKGTEPLDSVIRALFTGDKYKCKTGLLDTGYSMPANEEKTIVDIQFLEPNTITPDELEEKLSRCELEIQYTSFYNDKFSFISNQNNQ
ncbi:MAG: hypothetical protein ABW105_01640 [Candidatus Thiodiazotropha sp. 6PLUC1]